MGLLRDPASSVHRAPALAAAAMVACAVISTAQEQPEPLTLLPASMLSAIASEISGAQAFAHALDLVGYEHDRPPSEYGSGTYREAAYVAATAREYGFSDVLVERFPQQQPQWDGEMAELWIEQPIRKLIARYRDVPAMLVPGSRSADVTAPLVFVGRGDRESDYAAKPVAGAIVLVSGPVAAAHAIAVRRLGAAGVVSFYNGTGRPIDRPDQVAWNSLVPPGSSAADPQAKTTFGLTLSLRSGLELVDLVERQPRVVVRARIEAREHPADLQLVSATIPGDGSLRAPDKSELVFVAHLFEGIAKQGANDNASSVAVQLEQGRAWLALIRGGVLSRPRRTVRFLWVPEISGPRAYMERYPDFASRVLAAINMDAVSADQSKNKNSLHLNTTPDSLPSFLNDVCAVFFEYVGETNRDKLHNRRVVTGFQNPILDPRGSRDPFWYHVEKFYGSSDHQVFLDARPRIPAVQFGNWPEIVYHTSDDTPLFNDPTQMKRAAFLGLAVGHVLANATALDAVRIAALSAAYARRRIGDDLARASLAIDAAADAAALHVAYKESLNAVRWAHWREATQVRSAGVLAATDKEAAARIGRVEAAIRAAEPIDVEQIRTAYAVRCAALGIAPLFDPPATADEHAAARSFPRPAKDAAAALPASAAAALPGYYAMEARQFADGSRSLLDVRNAISAEFGPIALDRVVTFFRELERTGQWKLDAVASK